MYIYIHTRADWSGVMAWVSTLKALLMQHRAFAAEAGFAGRCFHHVQPYRLLRLEPTAKNRQLHLYNDFFGKLQKVWKAETNAMNRTTLMAPGKVYHYPLHFAILFWPDQHIRAWDIWDIQLFGTEGAESFPKEDKPMDLFTCGQPWRSNVLGRGASWDRVSIPSICKFWEEWMACEELAHRGYRERHLGVDLAFGVLALSSVLLLCIILPGTLVSPKRCLWFGFWLQTSLHLWSNFSWHAGRMPMIWNDERLPTIITTIITTIIIQASEPQTISFGWMDGCIVRKSCLGSKILRDGHQPYRSL